MDILKNLIIFLVSFIIILIIDAYKHMESQSQTLRLATFNIRNTADRYEERKDLLKSVI